MMKKVKIPITFSLRRGFTLIEILVVVAILGILLGGMVSVGSHVRTNAQIKNTKSVIRALVAALEEYRNYRGTAGSLGFDFPNFPVDLTNDPTNIVRLYPILNQIPSCRAILEKIPESNKELNAAGYIVLRDAWRDGNTWMPLEYIYNGPGNFPTIRSAGPDMQPYTADDIISTEL